MSKYVLVHSLSHYVSCLQFKKMNFNQLAHRRSRYKLIKGFQCFLFVSLLGLSVSLAITRLAWCPFQSIEKLFGIKIIRKAIAKIRKNKVYMQMKNLMDRKLRNRLSDEDSAVEMIGLVECECDAYKMNIRILCKTFPVRKLIAT